MPDRYTFHDHDTHGVVLDTQTGEKISFAMVRDAEVATRRWNAGEPKRAKDALAWGIVRNGRLLHLAFPGKPDHIALLSDERIARVRITEIEQEASDGE